MLTERTLADAEVAALGECLDEAAMACQPVEMFTERHPGMQLGDAYAIQACLRQRMESRGTRVTGLKMGLTSRAKMQQVGVAESIHGFITDRAAYGDGATIPVNRFIHPRIEAEIAVVMARSLGGANCTALEAGEAVDFVLPAIEIIDSRYADFRFDLLSVVSDNTSAAGYVLGGHSRSLGSIDVVTEGVVLTCNGEVKETGAGAAVLGNPLEAVALLARQRAALGEDIPAGSLVLTGGITAALQVKAGDVVTVHYQTLGTIRLRFS